MAAPKRNAWQYKVLNDEKIRPAFYDGSNVGHGKYFAAQKESGELIVKNKKPVPYKDIS
jgi:hypothetical protein